MEIVAFAYYFFVRQVCMENTIQGFISELSSKSPVPGGGGASALIGAIGVSLCSMVANLTSGKQKYAEYQQDIEKILARTEVVIKNLLSLIEKDAAVFEPLSAAYGIPKETPGRDDILEAALVEACSVPFEILKEVNDAIDIVEELAIKGSRLAISDVGVAASACKCAMESAAMNVYINTKLMKNRDYASAMNAATDSMLKWGLERFGKVYSQVSEGLR